jgi:outer membrane receptor for ferrienterochelin and colicins
MQYFGDAAINKRLKNGSIRYTFNIFNEKVTDRDSANITPYYAYGNTSYLYSQRVTNALFWNTKYKQKYPINIVASFSHYRRIKNTYRKDLVSLEEQIIPSADEQDTNYFNSWMSRGTFTNNTFSKKLSYQLGYEFNDETAEGKRIRGEQQTITDYNAFGSSEINIAKKLLIRPGLRLIYNTKYNAPIIPSLNFKWDANSIVTIRGSYGRGFRAPSLKELYLDFVDPSHNVQGNENLKAETQNNYQLAAAMQWKAYERVFSIEPAVYYNHITNKIDLALVDPATIKALYVNIADFRSVGTATNINYKAPHYSLTLGYSYMGVNNSLLNQVSNAPNYYFSSEYRANANYTFSKLNLTVATFYKYNGKLQNYLYDAITGEIKTGYINPYSLWDASLTKTFWAKAFSITAGVKNLLNVKNIAASIPTGVHSAGGNSASIAMGRTMFVSCAYTFNKTAK